MFRRILRLFLYLLLALILSVGSLWMYFHPRVDVQAEIGYTTRNGVPLSYDVVTPEKQNGAAVAVMISGSWKSNDGEFRPWPAATLLRRGYTLIGVRHLSQPRATVSEIVDDIHLAISHIRFHSANYGIEKDRIGISGGSSGGHLSLMLATTGDRHYTDLSEAQPFPESSRVQAVAVFFPVTDLVDLGPSTQNPGDGGPPMSYVKGFGFQPRSDDPKRIAPADLPAWKRQAHRLSPIHQLRKQIPPTLIIHGDADTLVPLDQSQRFLERAKALSLDQNIRLEIREGKGHGWPTMLLELPMIADWFDTHLAASSG